MQINITHERSPWAPKSGPITVGWFRIKDKAAVIYDPPERLSFRDVSRDHAKSAGRCPGVILMESRYFAIKSPVDLHLGYGRDEQGRQVLINRAGDKSTVRRNKLNELMTLVPENEWRYPERPTVQMALPYVFVADEPVYLTQIGAFAHYRADPLPGTVFGGRFPIDIWPRVLTWAFEWHDPEKDIVLKRGEPICYVQLEGDGPDRPIQLIETEKTPELLEYVDNISEVVSYVNQTFSLFGAAERMRPAHLLTPKKR